MRARRVVIAFGLVVILSLVLVLGLVWSPAGAQTAPTTTSSSSSTTSTTVDPASVAALAAAGLSLPQPTIATSPPAAQAQIVNLPTWLWVQPWAAVTNTATTGSTSVQVSATPTSVRFDTGDGQSLTCPGAGVPYDPSRPSAQQSSNCTHTWQHSSAQASGGAFHVTATVNWSITWSRGLLGNRQSAGALDLRVAEAQALDRPPVPLPGQTIIGGPGATDTPGTAWSGKAPAATDLGTSPTHHGDSIWGTIWHGITSGAKATWGFLKDTGTGLYHELKDTLILGFKMSPFYATINPLGFVKNLWGLVKGIGYGVQHPMTALKGLIDWKDLTNGHPGRALGHALPAIIAAIFSVGSSAGAKAAAAATEEERLAALAAETDRLAKLAEADRLAKLAAGGGDAASGGNAADQLANEAARAQAAADAADAAPNTAWEPGPGQRLPATENGSWSGMAGNSEWLPTDPARWGLEPGQTIPFREGVPDFSGYAPPLPNGTPGVFDVPGLTGSPSGDFRKAVAKIAADQGWSKQQVIDWLNENKLRIHHYKGNEMQLVPEDMHRIAHQGGAFDLRNSGALTPP